MLAETYIVYITNAPKSKCGLNDLTVIQRYSRLWVFRKRHRINFSSNNVVTFEICIRNLYEISTIQRYQRNTWQGQKFNLSIWVLFFRPCEDRAISFVIVSSNVRPLIIVCTYFLLAARPVPRSSRTQWNSCENTRNEYEKWSTFSACRNAYFCFRYSNHKVGLLFSTQRKRRWQNPLTINVR